MNAKTKQLILTTITCLIITFLAFITLMNLNMHGGHITDAIEKLNMVILTTFLISIVLRIIKPNKLIAIVIITADLVLVVLALDTFRVDSLLDLLKIILEPITILTVIFVAFVMWDWTRLFQKTWKKWKADN